MVDQPQSVTSAGSQVFMISTPINVATRSKDYQTPPPMVGKENEITPSSSIPSTSIPLHIEQPSPDFAIWPLSQGVLRKSSYNPNAWVAQHYNNVEDLAQAPLAMSDLEVLWSCPYQRKALVSAIGGVDPFYSNLIFFDLEKHVPRLPHQISFLIQVIINEKTIHRTIIEEDASTYIMFVSYWKAIGSPTLNMLVSVSTHCH